MIFPLYCAPLGQWTSTRHVARERQQRDRLLIRVGADEHDRVRAGRCPLALVGTLVVTDHERVGGGARQDDVELLDGLFHILRLDGHGGHRLVEVEVRATRHAGDAHREDDRQPTEDPGDEGATGRRLGFGLPVEGDGAERRRRKRGGTLAADAHRAPDASSSASFSKFAFGRTVRSDRKSVKNDAFGARPRVPTRPERSRSPYTAAEVTTAASCSAKNAISSGVPAVILSASGAPNAPIGRTITPRRSSASLSACASAPDLDEEEVADAPGRRIEASIAQHGLERAHRLTVDGSPSGELRLVVQRRECCDEPRRGDVERAAYLGDRLDHARGADSVPDAESGEPVDLGERPQHEHAVTSLRVLGDRVGVRPGRRCTRSRPGRRR